MSRKKKTNGITDRMTKSQDDGVFDRDVQSGYSNLSEEVLDQRKIDILYNNNLFYKRIIDEVPSDALKNGFTLDFGDGKEEVGQRIVDLYNKLQLDNYLTHFLQMGRKDGFAAILPVMKIKGDIKTSDILTVDRIAEITDFNVIKKSDVRAIIRNKDITKENYGEIEYITVLNPSTNQQVKYHRSWLQIFETGLIDSSTIIQDQFQLSLYAGLFDNLQVNYNINWSSGQAAFSSLAKVLKIGDQKELDKIRSDKDRYRKKKEFEINSSTLAVIGKDDSLEAVDMSQANYEGLQKVNLNDLSTRLGIPVSKLMGASAGALASATEDSQRYTEVVEQFQNVVVKDYLRYYISLFLKILKLKEERCEINFVSIKPKDSKKEKEEERLEAEKEKIQAETRKIKIDALISLNKELNDEDISNILKKLAQGLKDELLGEIDE